MARCDWRCECISVIAQVLRLISAGQQPTLISPLIIWNVSMQQANVQKLPIHKNQILTQGGSCTVIFSSKRAPHVGLCLHEMKYESLN